MLIDTKLLRQKILDLAIRGKLVPQDPADEPASELLKRIRAEKSALVKSGKLKKEKPLPSIPEDEIPFDIPDSWEWVRLCEIANVVSTKQHQILEKEVEKEGRIPVVSQGQNVIDGYSDKVELAIHDLPIVLFGDHTKNVKYLDFPFIIGADGCKLVKLVTVSARWFYCWLSDAATRIDDRGYARHWGQITKRIIPLPPLAEQKRIATKVESIMNAIEKITTN